jgi:hypothetical protein
VNVHVQEHEHEQGLAVSDETGVSTALRVYRSLCKPAALKDVFRHTVRKDDA